MPTARDEWEKILAASQAEHAGKKQYFEERNSSQERELIELKARLNQAERVIQLITGGTPDRLDPVWVFRDVYRDAPF